jgi:hypothetical protein
MRWTTEIHNEAAAVARAKLHVGRLKYVLGLGGRYPQAETPETKNGKTGCDCSGFVAWCFGYDRYQEHFPFGGWINTDAMIFAARRGGEWFDETELPHVGSLVVFPGIDLNKDGARERVGHVGVVSAIEGGSGSIWERMKVIHCSSGNQKRFGYAVAETNGGVFANREKFSGQENPRWKSTFLTVLGDNK